MKETTIKALSATLGVVTGTAMYFILRVAQPSENSSNKALSVLAAGVAIPVAYDEILKHLRRK